MSTLHLIATPIGNLADMTPRAIDTLRSLDVLFCEDTRHTGNLLRLLDIPRPRVLLSNHEHNERGNAARVVRYLDEGHDVSICSDAGFPIISDPGYPAVVAAIAAGHEIRPLPGACAALLAVTASGLPCSSFVFKGFAPRKPGARRRFLELDGASPHTLVFYESPFRVMTLLQDALDVLGDRPAAVCLELTKQFERIYRQPLSRLVAEPELMRLKGEAVIVIGGLRDGRDDLDEQPDEPDGDDAPVPDDAASGYVRL